MTVLAATCCSHDRRRDRPTATRRRSRHRIAPDCIGYALFRERRSSDSGTMLRRPPALNRLGLLSIMLLVVQQCSLFAVTARSVASPSSLVVICSVHGHMTVMLDEEDDRPVKPKNDDCQCCLARCRATPTCVPLVLAVAYALAPLWPLDQPAVDRSEAP